MVRKMILAVTGHRPNRLNNEYDGIGPCSDYIRKKLKEKIIQYDATKLISGMALGVDMIFAELAIEMGIPLCAAVPFYGQEKIWAESSKERWVKALDEAQEIQIVSPGGYTPWKMSVRNEWMVDNCEVLLAVWNGDKKGGTANCVKYAKKVGRTIDIISPDYDKR